MTGIIAPLYALCKSFGMLWQSVMTEILSKNQLPPGEMAAFGMRENAKIKN
jgi:hypothetical protein